MSKCNAQYVSEIERRKLFNKVKEIDSDGVDLSKWEINFIANIVDENPLISVIMAKKIYQIAEDRLQ